MHRVWHMQHTNGVKAVIVMPTTTPLIKKVERTKKVMAQRLFFMVMFMMRPVLMRAGAC